MALQLLGNIVTASGNVVSVDDIDDFHAMLTYTDPSYRTRIIQKTTSGPTLASSTAHNQTGSDSRGACVFPGTTFGLAISGDFPGSNQGDVYAQVLEFNLSANSVTAHTIAQALNITGTLGQDDIQNVYGITATKAFMFGRLGNYCFFTRSGTTVTIESAAYNRIGSAENAEFLSVIPADDTAMAVVYRDQNTQDIYVAKVDINAGTNSLNLNPGTLVQSGANLAGKKLVRYEGAYLSSANGLVILRDSAAITGNDETGILNQVNEILTTVGPDTSVLARAWYTINRINDTSAVVVYNDGPRFLRAEIITISGQNITFAGFPLELEDDFSGAVVCYGIFVTGVNDYATTVWQTAGAIISVAQIDGGGDFGGGPTIDYTLTHSGRHAFAVSADGATLALAVKDGSNNHMVLTAPRSGMTSWTTAYNPGGGTVSNVDPVPTDANSLIFYGNYGANIGVIKHTITPLANQDISPTGLGANAIEALEISKLTDQEIIAGVGTAQTIIYTQNAGTVWSTPISGLGFDPLAIDVLWTGINGNHRFMYGGATNLFYTPNMGTDNVNYTGPITGDVIDIGLSE